MIFSLFHMKAGSQLVVNVKNKGGDILREMIQANTTQDTVTLEFPESDGTLVTQFIDFKNVSLEETLPLSDVYSMYICPIILL